MIAAFAWFASYVVVAAISFLTLGLLFIPLERTFAARPQRMLRADWSNDVVFFFGQHLLWTTAVLAALTWIANAWRSIAPLELLSAFSQLALWQQTVVALLLGDVLLYWGHRLQHRMPLLWRFHRTHHTAQHLDWIAAYREHPLDGLYTRGLVNLPAIMLGFPLEAVAGVLTFRGLWAVFIHSNVRLKPGPLKFLLGSPHLHLWHHALTSGSGCNFANLMPMLDVLFGTYYEPKHSPAALGTHGPIARSYLEHLLQPLLPERRCTMLSATSGSLILILAMSFGIGSACNCGRSTDLIHAAWNGSAEDATAGLKSGVDINATDEMGNSALTIACRTSHWLIAKMLLDSGANTNLHNMNAGSALTHAVINGHYSTVRLLLDHGADVKSETAPGMPVLSYALDRPEGVNLEIVRALLSAGADPNFDDGDGGNALTEAVAGFSDNHELVRLLIDAGAKPPKDILEYAVKQRASDEVMRLLRAAVRSSGSDP